MDQFIEYVYKFYGHGGIYASDYPNRVLDLPDGFTREEIEAACHRYRAQNPNALRPAYDSVDRENVRALLDHTYNPNA